MWYEGAGLSNRRWLQGDERGSIVSVTDGTGATIALNAYDEYGIPASTNMGRFQYTGQTWLPEAGLYYYKARMYSATLGRFMQTDPIGYKDGINWYDYVDGDPVNRTDPTGLCRDRGENGNCVVWVEKGGGEAERQAAQKLANRLTALDKGINALSDRRSFAVRDKDGKVVGQLKGSEIKAQWNSQRWSIAPKGTQFSPGNDRGATDAKLDSTRLSAKSVEGYAKVGGNVTGLNTIVGHELGHTFKDQMRYMPTYPKENEARAHSLGKTLINAAGESFNCSVGGGCD